MLVPLSRIHLPIVPSAHLALGTHFPLTPAMPGRIRGWPEAMAMGSWCCPSAGLQSALKPGCRDWSAVASTPACWERTALPGTGLETPRAGGTHSLLSALQQVPAAAAGGCWRPGRAIAVRGEEPAQHSAALLAASPAPVSPLCSLVLDLIPYNTSDLSLSLSCAFEETPLFISFLLLFIITKSF